MEGERKILIRRDWGWEDVTDKDAIIYGAGQGCLDLMGEWQIPNVEYVIDSNEEKWGSTLLLLGQVYSIRAPELLLELPLEKYYIIISTFRYAEEIKKNIANYVDIDAVSICEDLRTLCSSYTYLEDLLFYDPRIKKSLVITSWSYNLDRLINTFMSVREKVFPEGKIECFLSIGYGASKVIFCFCIKKQFYIFSIPGMYCEGKAYIHHPEERKKRYQFRKDYDIGNELTLYEDSAGAMIQYLANPFPDCSNDSYKLAVLKKCYELHQLNRTLEIQHNFIKEPYENMAKRFCNIFSHERKRIEILNSYVCQVFEKISKINLELKICHGDLRIQNIVFWKNEAVFIDWELMTMGDPMYDVCEFLFYCGDMEKRKRGLSYRAMAREIYYSLRKYLSFYYGRACTDAEYYHAQLVMLAKESKEFMYTSSAMNFIDNEKYWNLLGRLEKWKEMNFEFSD